MTVYVNYDDVLAQLRSLGLVVDSIDVGTPRPRRVKVEGERERKGWYWLHEFRPDVGGDLIVGTFGIWHGNEPNTQKIKLRNIELSDEQKKALKKRFAADRRRADALREREAAKASARAAAMWDKIGKAGDDPPTMPYLEKKMIGGYGTRGTPDGTLVVPMMDIAGQIHGLQFIGPEVRKKLKDTDKQFWPYGMNPIGRHLLIGSPGWLILICEGYATAATLHEQTGHAVVAAFTAGNLLQVAEVMRKRYRHARILICADDDFASRGNPGVSSAKAAALAVSGEWVAPIFEGDPFRADLAAAELDQAAPDYKQRVEEIRRGRPKLTDFNDLQAFATPRTVGAQIEARLAELKWGEGEAVREVEQSGGGGAALKPITSVRELFDRFAIVYGHNKALFDFQERMLVSLEDMKNACSGRETWRTWMESPDKKIVRIRNVGFDPAGEDPEILCNTWGGMQMQPHAGKCELLLGLLEYLCANEKNHAAIYQWILNWLAYPLQHPGAKMKTALVFHGPQRVGKNFFFESIMSIYGEYGQVIDQDALEDKYNDFYGHKLFIIADEVIARQEMWHVKNKLKGMITCTRIRINPKGIKSYWETNHCNLVFLSNETIPLILDRDDGRHVVIWTPPKLSKEFYGEVEQEVREGGVAALYDFLMRRELGDFNEHTPPPMTAAKQDLMDLSMDSTERFMLDWKAGRIEHVPLLPTKSTRVYSFYREYAGRHGFRYYDSQTKFLSELVKRHGAQHKQSHYVNGAKRTDGTDPVASFVFPPGVEQPPDKTLQQWLGECLTQFDFGVTQWREEGKHNDDP